MSTETAHSLLIVAYGTPTPQGSKRVLGRAGQRGVLVDVNKARLTSWRDDVRQAALHAVDDTPGWERDHAGVMGSFIFTLKRPRAHHMGGDPTRELRGSAPICHVGMPDLDKLLRSTWDALVSAGTIYDDCRLTQVYAAKFYTDPGKHRALDRPGCTIILTGVTP